MQQSQSNGNDYKVSSRSSDYIEKKYSTVIKLHDDPDSTLDIKVVMEDKGFENNCAELIGNALKKENKFISINGLSLSSTCVISDIKKADYDREIGYIQTTKKFFEIQFEKAIFYSDFQSNLLHDQDKVLDCDGENKPFYSKVSSIKISDGEEFPSYETIALELNHSPTCEERLNSDWGSPQKLERYQQFFVSLVMRSKKGTGKWEYDVLYSFEWFIYLKWIGETQTNNNIFEWDFNIKKLNDFQIKKVKLEFNEKYICNDDEFEYWIDREKDPKEFHNYRNQNFIYDMKNFETVKPEFDEYYTFNGDEFEYWIDKKFHIYRYPNSIYTKSLNKPEEIYKNINNKISEQRNPFENIKDLVLKVLSEDKFCKNIEVMDETKKIFRKEIQSAIIKRNLNENNQRRQLEQNKLSSSHIEALNKTKNNGKSDFANKQDEQSNNN